MSQQQKADTSASKSTSQETPQETPAADTLNQQLGVLTRREVEARILQPFVKALTVKFGQEEVLEVLRDTVINAAKEVGSTMRETSPDASMSAFASHWEPWFRGGALEVDTLTQTESEWRFNVTRCRYAELYRSLGMADLGATLSCNRDAALVEGFAEDIAFTRSQTIMQGASHCDFHYQKKKTSET
ncbi:MAG: L-2-amino-thiazoline-4-carboxylic acid hydrolase [Deinococcota bacterium]